jgi:hypothetical protein
MLLRINSATKNLRHFASITFRLSLVYNFVSS